MGMQHLTPPPRRTSHRLIAIVAQHQLLATEIQRTQRHHECCTLLTQSTHFLRRQQRYSILTLLGTALATLSLAAVIRRTRTTRSATSTRTAACSSFSLLQRQLLRSQLCTCIASRRRVGRPAGIDAIHGIIRRILLRLLLLELLLLLLLLSILVLMMMMCMVSITISTTPASP
jgi:hypothetical protein